MQVTKPIYRGCKCLGIGADVLLTRGGKVKDYPIASWTYDAKDAVHFCLASTGPAIGLVLVRRTSDAVVINFHDNASRFGPDLRDAVETYDQQEILVAAPAAVYRPTDVAAIGLRRENFGWFNRELGWKLSAKFGRHTKVVVVNPATKPHILRYA